MKSGPGGSKSGPKRTPFWVPPGPVLVKNVGPRSAKLNGLEKGWFPGVPPGVPPGGTPDDYMRTT